MHPLYITDEEEAMAVKTVTDPTCTESGAISFTASFENKRLETQIQSTAIPRLGHDYQETVDEAHLKTPATCTRKAVYYDDCSRCDAKLYSTFEYGEPLGHDFDSSIYACSRCGLFTKGPTGGYVFYD